MSTPEELQEKLLQDSGARVVLTLQALSRAVVLYESNNAIIVRLVDQLFDTVKGYRDAGGGGLKVQVMADEVFVNGRLLKVDPNLYERSTDLHRRLEPLQVSEFAFGVDFSRDNAEAFVSDLSQAFRRGEPGALRAEGYGGLSLGQAKGSAIASFRFEPDRLAVWLYTSLLDMVERLYAAHAQGRSPSLLPMKRSVQLVIDNMRAHGAIYQLLAAVQNPNKRSSKAFARVAISVDLIGFGLFLGLPNGDLMTLALAGILGGLTDSASPLESVRALFSFPGLGDSAVPLTLLLHDARLARKGETTGFPGAVLATAEEYSRATLATSKRAGVSAYRAIHGLKGGKIRWVPPAIAQAFVAYKGPYPIGTLVTLSPQGLAVVVGQGDSSTGKRRPIVALVRDNGRLGSRVDLTRDRNTEIVGAPEPSQVDVQLALHA